MMKNSFIPSSIQLARRDKREVDMEAEFLRFDNKMTKLVEKIIKLSGCEQRYKIGGFISLELKFSNGLGGESSWSYNSQTKQAYEIHSEKTEDEKVDEKLKLNQSVPSVVSSDDPYGDEDILSRGSVVVGRRSPRFSDNRRYRKCKKLSKIKRTSSEVMNKTLLKNNYQILHFCFTTRNGRKLSALKSFLRRNAHQAKTNNASKNKKV